MSQIVTDIEREVPQPGAVFWEKVTHPQNLELLEGDEKNRKLEPDKLKEAQSQLAVLQYALNVYREAYIRHIEEHLSETQRALDLHRQLEEAGTVSADNPPDFVVELRKNEEKLLKRIERTAKRLYPGVKPPPKKRRISITDTQGAREAQTAVNKLIARLDEHRRAIENEAINRRLQDEMLNEISYYGRQIVDRWTALGYREEVIKKGKKKLRRVKIAEAHYTEDNIQFKVLVTSIALFGSTIQHMPYSVKGWDLIKPETLRELEAGCECPVTSPHTEDDENQGFDNGIWLIVHRVGMRDGLFDYIELGSVLPKYNLAMRHKFAVPVGIKAGRIIEYLYLVDTPHFMFNGITGSGKTNVGRVFLSVLSQFYSPDEIRFVLVDLKRSGDLNPFADIPHIIGGGIIKNIDSLADILPRLVALMYWRMERFSDLNVVDIQQYNSRVATENRMPRIVVFIDESGSIRDLADPEQRDTIFRSMALLTALARAAGIHLGVGSQQPSKEALPTKVTNNITYTIMGRQRTGSGSMMSLGNNRLKELPAIRGRMLVDNGFNLVPVQTPYATDADIERAVQIAKDYPAPRMLVLPGADDVPEAAEPVEVVGLGVTRERIIDLAVEEHGGVMNAQKIYEITGKVTPRGQIQKMIYKLRDEKAFTHRGVDYRVVPHGKGYRIQKAETPDTGISITGVLDGDTADLPVEPEVETV